MLVPIVRAPSILSRSLLGSLAPTVSCLCSHLPELRRPKIPDAPQYTTRNHPALPSKIVNSYNFPSRVKSADSSAVSPRILGLFGIRNTEKIVGPSVLRYVTTRDFSSTGATKVDDVTPPRKALMEPFGSIVKFLEPEFLRARLVKTDQVETAQFFSYGKNQYLSLSVYVRSNGLESVGIFFGNTGGDAFCMLSLIEQFEPVAYAKNQSELNAISEKFRLNDKNAPRALRDVGAFIHTLTMLRQVINFMEKNKRILTELFLPEFRHLLKNWQVHSN